ncbi:MAG: hypothetical protein HC785_29095 [Calothrix sp. CSU_2_0]|nr:hypothetical protein [Calothrix sp. CSU_2_0]
MEKLNRDDVVQILEDGKSLCNGDTFTVEQAIEALIESLNDSDLVSWGRSGVRCRYLSATSGGWKAGKVRLSLVFAPDGECDKSVLDDLREQLSKDVPTH